MNYYNHQTQFLLIISLLLFCSCKPMQKGYTVKEYGRAKLDSSGTDRTSVMPPQSTAILVEPGEFFWRVDSISLEWQVQVNQQEGKTSTINWSFENSSDFVKKASGGVKIESGSSVNLDLGIVPKANASVFAKAGVWVEGGLAWGSSQQRKARECSDAFTSSSELKSHPQISFSIWFYNKSTNDYEILNATIPICIKDNVHVAMAKAHKNYDAGNGTILIPAKRPSGVPVKFIADLDTTTAQSVVDYIQDNSPIINLENSQIKIYKRGQSQQVDIIPEFERIKNSSVPVSIKTDAIVMSWRVDKTKNTSLKTVFDAINSKMGESNDSVKWINYNQSGVTEIGGVKNSQKQTWHFFVNRKEVVLRNPDSITVNQPIEFALFITPKQKPKPSPYPQPTPKTKSPVETQPDPLVAFERSMLIGTWKWNEVDRTIIGTFDNDGAVYLVNKAKNPSPVDIANGKGTWSFENKSLTVEMNRVGLFGVYKQYGPVKWIHDDEIISFTETEIKLKSGKILLKQ